MRVRNIKCRGYISVSLSHVSIKRLPCMLVLPVHLVQEVLLNKAWRDLQKPRKRCQDLNTSLIKLAGKTDAMGETHALLAVPGCNCLHKAGYPTGQADDTFLILDTL